MLGSNTLRTAFLLATAAIGPILHGQNQTPANLPPSTADDRVAIIARNKALNDVYTEARQALDSKHYDVAIDRFNKAAALDPGQVAVWGGLADACVGAAAQDPSYYERAFDAFRRAIELQPNDAGFYNNYALALAKSGKPDEARRNLDQAARLDPTGAGKYFYNFGAMLANGGQSDAALTEFKRAIDADPNYDLAQYQYGASLAGRATVDATGRIVAPPGAVEALRKYLALKPGGPYAASAAQLVAALGFVITLPKERGASGPRAAAPGAIHVGGNVQVASLIRQIRPLYPPAAKAVRVQGTVKLLALIGRDGTIENLEFAGGPALLVQAAMDAVSQWTYQPALLEGRPVEVLTTIDVNFTLSQ